MSKPDIVLNKLQPRPFVGIRRSVPVAELAAYYGEVLPKVMRWVTERGIAPASMPMCVWHAMDMETGVADCQAGVFVHEAVEAEGEFSAGFTQGGDVLQVMHTGPYDTVGRSWMAAYQRAGELGRAPGAGWEIYLDDPGQTAPEQLRTHIHLPLLDPA